MLPDGKFIVLERQQGADARGFSGLEDEVDYHWWDLIKAAALSTLLSVGAEIGSDRDENDLVRALRRGSQDSINNTGQQLVRRQLNIQPTLTIRQGFPVRVIVNRDLVMAHYGQQEASRRASSSSLPSRTTSRSNSRSSCRPPFTATWLRMPKPSGARAARRLPIQVK